MSTDGEAVAGAWDPPPIAGGEGGLAGLAGRMALVEAAGVSTPATVASVHGSAVTVTCDEDCWSGRSRDEVLVSVFAPDALYRISGPAEVDGREVTTAAGALVERVQRRKWPRRRMDLAVTLCPVSEGVRLEGVPGRTVDVSIGGLCVETLRPVEGTPMVILSLPDGTTIVSGASTVVSEDLGDGWRYRLAFDRMDSRDAVRLAELTTG